MEIVNTRDIKKNSARQLEYRVKFVNISPDLVESLTMIDKVFRQIISEILINTKPKDLIKSFIHHPNLNEDIKLGKFQSNLINVSDVDADFIIDTIIRLAQSGKKINLDSKLTFNVGIINYKEGGGKRECNDRIEKYLYKKQFVVKINENEFDNLCALRAVVVAKASADKDINYERIIKGNKVNNLQIDLARKLADDLSFDYSKKIGIAEIIKIEEFLIILIDGDNLNNILYGGTYKDKQIILFLKIIIMMLLNHYQLFSIIIHFVLNVLNHLSILSTMFAITYVKNAEIGTVNL